MIRRLWLRVRAIAEPGASERDMQDEMRQHIDRATERLMARGLSRRDARAEAAREFGNIGAIQEEARDARGSRWSRFASELGQDVRYGVRSLARKPTFTIVAVLTLTLGVGANTAIFSIVNAVLLQTFPYPDPNQLVLVFNIPLNQPDALSSISYRDFTQCREQNREFSEMAGNSFHDLTLTGAGEPSIVNTAAVTPQIFPLLGAKPLAGRTLLPDDGKQGAAPVAVVSENLWYSRFGSDPALIGQSITLDMRPFTVVGILPASFRYPDGAPRQDVWISVAQDPLFGPRLSQPGSRVLVGVGRLRRGFRWRKLRPR